MTRRADSADTATHAARSWRVPRHLWRFRTSTVLLVLVFLATAVLRNYYVQVDNAERKRQQEAGTGAVPTETAPSVEEWVPTTTTTPPSTTTPGPTSIPETAGTTGTVTPSPLIVLPPGLVPSGVELPPGIAVETTQEQTSAPASSAPAGTS